MQKFKSWLATAGLVVSGAAMVLAPVAASATTSTVTVYPGHLQGWLLNADPSSATPYTFSTAHASIGTGSLYVPPIGATPSNKFIAIKPSTATVASLNSVSYDFLIAGNGTSASANQFYLNIYTNLPGSTTYYDCRFDYAPTAGSTSTFTTATLTPASTPSHVQPRGGAACPTTLAGMLSGSKVNAFAINVGDTSASDQNLAGYLDKVVINAASDVTTYNFEATTPVVSKPAITSPANNSTLTSAQLTKIDWTDATTTGNGPVKYQYQAFSSPTYATGLVYDSGPTLTISEIPTPGTPEGVYYVRVRAIDADGNEGAWSNDSASPYKITVSNSPSKVQQCLFNGYTNFTGPASVSQTACIQIVVARLRANLTSYLTYPLPPDYSVVINQRIHETITFTY